MASNLIATVSNLPRLHVPNSDHSLGTWPLRQDHDAVDVSGSARRDRVCVCVSRSQIRSNQVEDVVFMFSQKAEGTDRLFAWLFQTAVPLAGRALYKRKGRGLCPTERNWIQLIKLFHPVTRSSRRHERN